MVVSYMKSEEIRSLCLSNPMAVADYIESLESHLNELKEKHRKLKALETELEDSKKELRNMKDLETRNFLLYSSHNFFSNYAKK